MQRTHPAVTQGSLLGFTFDGVTDWPTLDCGDRLNGDLGFSCHAVPPGMSHWIVILQA